MLGLRVQHAGVARAKYWQGFRFQVLCRNKETSRVVLPFWFYGLGARLARVKLNPSVGGFA